MLLKPRYTELAERFPLGSRVTVKATVKKSNSTEYDTDLKPIPETLNRWYLVRNEFATEKQPSGLVCGVDYVPLGEIHHTSTHHDYEGFPDVDPGYLKVSEYKQVLLIALSYGRRVRVLPDDAVLL